MKWIQYREKWAHGPGKWEWTHFPDNATEEDYQEFALEISQQYYWSEMFRGVEWNEAEVPEEILSILIRKAENAVESAKRYVNSLKEFKDQRNEKNTTSKLPS